jgi:hypothetical protein
MRRRVNSDYIVFVGLFDLRQGFAQRKAGRLGLQSCSDFHDLMGRKHLGAAHHVFVLAGKSFIAGALGHAIANTYAWNVVCFLI